MCLRTNVHATNISTVLPSSEAPSSSSRPLSKADLVEQTPATGLYDGLSVAVLKARTKSHTEAVARGASALALVRGARRQILLGHNCESSGELKGAFVAYTRAILLVQSFMRCDEYETETRQGRQGMLSREWEDFVQVRVPSTQSLLHLIMLDQREGNGLQSHVDALENLLQEMETLLPQ
jgi:hypothetical protein